MLVSQSFSSSDNDKYHIPDYIYNNKTGQPDNIIHGNSEMYKHQVTLIKTASFLGLSRIEIVTIKIIEHR